MKNSKRRKEKGRVEEKKAGVKVMIVDDDKEFLEELNETLELSGYDMIAVNDPADVLDTASSIKPDVILLDLKMPGKSGFQLASELRHLSFELSQTPIIAMSAYFKDDFLPLLDMCGIRRYLRKPFNALDVIDKIEDVLREDR